MGDRVLKHVEPLDGLRAVAVLIVMISHAGLGHIVPGGFGVTMFFFLSGYLITTLMRLEIARTGAMRFGDFYLRRTVRIIPPMLICIAVTVALWIAGWIDRDVRLDRLWTDILFLTNYASLLGGGSNLPIPLWSLDVEEHFYLLFPLIYVGLHRRSAGLATTAILAGLVLALAARWWTYTATDQAQSIFYWTHTRIDSILYGCLLAVWNNPVTGDRAWIGPGKRWLIAGLAVLAATFVLRDPLIRETVRYSLQGMALLLVFNHILRTRGIVSKALSVSPLRWIGNWSYVLYLIHMPLFLVAEHFLGMGPAAYALGFLLSHGFAAAMYRFVEQPLLRWRKRLQKGIDVPAPMHPKGVE